MCTTRDGFFDLLVWYSRVEHNVEDEAADIAKADRFGDAILRHQLENVNAVSLLTYQSR